MTNTDDVLRIVERAQAKKRMREARERQNMAMKASTWLAIFGLILAAGGVLLAAKGNDSDALALAFLALSSVAGSALMGV